MTKEIIPIFYDHTTLKSILTPWTIEETKPNGPMSVFKLAKDHNLKEVYLVGNKFYSFIEAWKNAAKYGVKLIFGLEVWLCKDAHERSPESTNDESKVIIWIKNGAGYAEAIKIFSEIHTDPANKYYHIRGSWANLKRNWTDNLFLSVPFFDSFLHRNALNYGSQIIPDFPCEPFFHMEVDSGLPFAFIIEDAIKKYGVPEERIINTKTIFYEKKKFFKAWQINRTFNLRDSDYSNPNLHGCVSDNFSFEDYLNLTK